MIIFVESLDQGIWDAIENDPFIPKFEKDGSSIEKPWFQWTDAENKKAKLDCIAKNIITSIMNSNEFFRISQCESAKEMWDTLEVIHEGTNENEEKMISLLSKKLRKFLKKRISKSDSSKRYDNKNSTKVNTNKYAYFGCGEQGHTKVECLNKEKKNLKKHEKKRKSRKSCNDDSSSSSSSKDEKANLCLMAKKEDDSSKESSVSSYTSLNVENYSQLLQAFKETHEEANRLALLNNRFKGMNNWLENRVKALEEELKN